MFDDARYLVLVLAVLALAWTLRYRVRQNRRRALYRSHR